jgi:hypothetical protein
MSFWNIVGFEVGNVAKGQYFLGIIQFYPTSIISPKLHTHSFIYHRRYTIVANESDVEKLT